MHKLLMLLLLAAVTGPAAAIDAGPAAETGPTGVATTIPVKSADEPPATKRAWFENLGRDFGAFNLVSDKATLSFHKPMFLLPLTYSEDYRNDHTEVLFQISLKQQLFRRNVYFAYTQKSFWQLYNGADSRPFRETDYNPELFLRFRALGGTHWGVDGGGEHESNGRPLPESRSWNRLYLAAYHENARDLAYVKVWWRLPEKQRDSPTDSKGDDNPDIEDFYGYAELHLARLFGSGQQMANLMLRANPSTGKGAVNLVWSAPFGDYAFWSVYLWHGYGESLLDYNHKVTRLGVGFSLAR